MRGNKGLTGGKRDEREVGKNLSKAQQNFGILLWLDLMVLLEGS